MRLVRFAFASSVSLGVVAAASAAGCHTATQITLELSTTATCGDLHGTAITVGMTPKDTEDRVGIGYVSAKTSDCTDFNKQIGTLVITPNDDMRGAVVVVVAYSSPTIPIHDPADCKPPLYQNCIVARRSFSFVEHTKLRMPITIEPDCLNVPCDAVTTCHKGKCFDSTVAPTGGDETTQPGEKPNDGGFDEAGVVDVVTPPPPPPPDDGGLDAPPDGPPEAGPNTPECLADGLHCGAVTCGANRCCPPTNTPTCETSCSPAMAYCCHDVDCPSGYHCAQPIISGPAASCVVNPPTGPHCVGTTLYCPLSAGGTGICNAPVGGCCVAPPAADELCTVFPPACTGANRYCCNDDDCGGTPLSCTILSSISNPKFPQPGTSIGTCK